MARKRQAADIIVPDVELQDVTLTEQVTRRRHIVTKEGTTEEEAQEPLPEEIMTKLDEFTGDSKGRVTVGVDFASSIEFGMKAGAFVSIGVSCDSSEEAIEGTHGIIYPLAKKLALEDHAEMSALRDSMLPDDARHKALGDKVPGGVSEKPSRPRASKKKAARKKGSFRRGG